MELTSNLGLPNIQLSYLTELSVKAAMLHRVATNISPTWAPAQMGKVPLIRSIHAYICHSPRAENYDRWI